MLCGGDARGWDNQAIIMAAEPGIMPVGRLFCLAIAMSKTDIQDLPPSCARTVFMGVGLNAVEGGVAAKQAWPWRVVRKRHDVDNIPLYGIW
jgi:hypothetical protein